MLLVCVKKMGKSVPIRISKCRRNELKRIRVTKRETYDEILKRVLVNVKPIKKIRVKKIRI